MKLLTTVFFSILSAMLFAAESQAQYTENALANATATNSPYPASSYQSYARSLEKTLAVLSPAQLSDIFRGPSSVSTPKSGSVSSGDSASYEDDTSESASYEEGASSSASHEESSSESAEGSASSPPDYTTTPEYTAALDGFNQAYSYFVDAQDSLSQTQAALHDVISSYEEFTNDGVPGSFVLALQGAAYGFFDAQDTYNQAQQNLNQAQQELDDIRDNGPHRMIATTAKLSSSRLDSSASP